MREAARTVRTVSIVASLSVAVLMFQNCGQVQFGADGKPSIVAGGEEAPTIQPLPEAVAELPPVPVCQPSYYEVQKPTRIIFALDVTGSNVDRYAGAGAGTDPQKSWRKKVLSDFTGLYKAGPNLKYASFGFTSGFVHPFTSSGTYNSTGFTSEQSKINEAYRNFLAKDDYWGTGFADAFDEMIKLIKSEVAKPGVDANTEYQIVFLSDGFSGQPGDFDVDTPAAQDKLRKAVQEVLAAGPAGKVKFNSVYYYRNTPEQKGVDVMSFMAQAGAGTYLTANSGQLLGLTETIKLTDQSCL